MSRIGIMSLWRNDAHRNIEARVAHLALKAGNTAHEISYHWVVGDSSDSTAEDLARFAEVLMRPALDVEILIVDSGIAGEDTPTRRCRLSHNASALFAELPEDLDYVLLHESDILSPESIVDQLLDVGPRHLPCAAWPVMELHGRDVFYDIWAFRDLGGVQFRQVPPYAKGWSRTRRPFRVSSFGTVWLAPAGLVRGRVLDEHAIVDLCKQWGEDGVALWCAPRVVVRQPTELWSPA